MEVAKWTWGEYDLIRKEYPSMGTDLVTKLEGRSVDTLTQKADRLEVNTDRPFTETERALAEQYGKSLGTALMFLMPDRTPYEVAELLK